MRRNGSAGGWASASPELLVVPDLGTPLLWCLGRPKLLLPAALVKSLDLDRWRGILTHELAHLRRGDHWVSRLELVAGLIWWWNPVYWLARARLDAEAELACDAWVVWTLPKDRLAYAEALFQICSTLSLAKPPAPALGVAGSGRFFERRLTMILARPRSLPALTPRLFWSRASWPCSPCPPGRRPGRWRTIPTERRPLCRLPRPSIRSPPPPSWTMMMMRTTMMMTMRTTTMTMTMMTMMMTPAPRRRPRPMPERPGPTPGRLRPTPKPKPRLM